MVIEKINNKREKEMKFTIFSKKDKISTEVKGDYLYEAIDEILHLNSHDYLSSTDWMIYNEAGTLIVNDGIEI